MKIALIGAGYWGKNHLRVFNQLAVLKTVCDLNEKILEDRKKEYPELRFTTDISEVLEDREIKAVVIATPAIAHYELAKKALERGKDVFVEKPLALNLEDGRELVKLAEEKNLILMVGHLLHYHPAVIELKSMIDKGELGEIRYVCSNRLNLGKLRQEENVLWSFAPHDISIIIDILGMPQKVSAIGKSYLQENVPDVTLSILEFEKNKTAHIFVSWLNPFKEQKLSIIGSEKMAVFDGVENKLVIYPHRIRNNEDGAPELIKADGQLIDIPFRETLMEQAKYFLRCLENREKPKTDGKNGLNVLKVLDECQKSLDRNDKEQCSQIHEITEVSKEAEIGQGTKIWHNCQVLKGAKVGKNCIIGHNCFVGSEAKIGNGVKIESNTDIWDLVVLEDYVFVGPSAVFTNDLNPRARYPKSKYPEHGKWLPTLVKEGASIGANATILCGITIGKGALIGAGAVVTKDIPDYAVVVGNPARVIGWVCECGNKIDFEGKDSICNICKRKYVKREEPEIQQI